MEEEGEEQEGESENGGQIDASPTTPLDDDVNEDEASESNTKDAEYVLSDKYLLSNWYYLLAVGLLLICAMVTICICCARMSTITKEETLGAGDGTETHVGPKAMQPPMHSRVMSASGFSGETDIGDGGIHEVTVQMMTPHSATAVSSMTPGLLQQSSHFAAVTPVTPLAMSIDMGDAGEAELPIEAEDPDDDMYEDTDEDALDVLYDEQMRRTAGNTPDAYVDDNAAMTPQHPPIPQ